MLLKNGIVINNKLINLKISCFCLDVPAKSYILQIKGHSGFNSCTRCTKEGEYIENRMCFPYITGESLPARSHNDYITKKIMTTTLVHLYLF